MQRFPILASGFFLLLLGCRSVPPCPEPFVEFPTHFSVLQKIVLPKLQLPVPIGLARVSRDGRNWDVTLMDPLLRIPLLEFHKRGFRVTQKSPLDISESAEDLNRAFWALRYFYESDDFVCANHTRTLDIRDVHIVLSSFRGEGKCRFPQRIDVSYKDGRSLAFETINFQCQDGAE